MAAPTNLNFAQKTSASVPAEQKINVFFDWKGPTSTFKGKLYCGVVDLIIEGAKTEISISIPKQNGSDTVQSLAFTLRKNPRTFLLQESECNALKLSIEQIQKLTIKAGMFEPSPHKGPAIMNSLGQRIDEERLLRTDQKIELQKPEDLKAGQVYRLVVTSDDLDLTASLVKEEPKSVSSTSTTTDSVQLMKDRQELFELIRGPLLMGLGANLMVFTAKISTIKTRTPFDITPNPNMNGLIQIRAEINKMDKKVLSDLMKAVRPQMPQWTNESNSIAKKILEKKILGMCFAAVTATGLENMMRAHLKAVTENQCSEEFDPIISQISKRFSEICMNNVTVTP